MPRDHDFNNGVIIFYIIYNAINMVTLMNVHCICLTVVKCFSAFFFWRAMDTMRVFGKNK